MFRPWLDSLRQPISGERALEMVRTLTRFHRVQASPGLDQAADFMAGELERAGLQVELERVAADGRTRLLGQVMPQGWACERAWADLVEGDRRERLCDYGREALSIVLRSTPARGRYRLVTVGSGTEAHDYEGREVVGCVVLASGDVHRVHELAVLQRRAAGILTDTRRLVLPVRGPGDERDAINYTSFWWAGDEPRGWGFVIAPGTADRLRERLQRGDTLELEVEIDSRAFDTTMPLLSGVLPGRDPREVVVISHLCHPRPSANDNASGVAANFEAARVLAERVRNGGARASARGLRFLWVPELTGTHAFFGREPRHAERIVAALNLDMVGENQDRCGSTFLLEHPPVWAASFAEAVLARIRAEALDWVTSYSGPGHYSMTRMAEVPYGGGSDHAVFVDPGIGVPCPMLIQWPDRFYHSSHDTPDKTDPASLALAVRCAATYAAFLADAGESEVGWITELVERDGRRRVLQALDEPDPARAVEREALRAGRAIESLARLDVAPTRVDSAHADLRSFVEREAGAFAAKASSPQATHARRPRRGIAAPLGFPRRLLPGFHELPFEAREAWRRRELATPDAGLLSELAWLACDGRRSIDEIRHLVWLETGIEARDHIESFFELTARLGLSDWIPEEEAACNPSAPDMAGR